MGGEGPRARIVGGGRCRICLSRPGRLHVAGAGHARAGHRSRLPRNVVLASGERRAAGGRSSQAREMVKIYASARNFKLFSRERRSDLLSRAWDRSDLRGTRDIVPGPRSRQVRRQPRSWRVSRPRSKRPRSKQARRRPRSRRPRTLPGGGVAVDRVHRFPRSLLRLATTCVKQGSTHRAAGTLPGLPCAASSFLRGIARHPPLPSPSPLSSSASPQSHKLRRSSSKRTIMQPT